MGKKEFDSLNIPRENTKSHSYKISRRNLIVMMGLGLGSTTGLSQSSAAESTSTDSVNLTAQSGLAYDGNVGYLTINNKIKKFDPDTLEVLSTVATVEGRSAGLAYGGGSLWYSDWIGPDYSGEIVELDPSDWSVQSRISSYYDPRGMAFANGSLWVAEITYNTIREFSTDGNQLSQFSVPTITPQGLAYINESLWLGDYCYGDDGCTATLYEYSTDGNLIQKTDQRTYDGEYGGYGSLTATDTELIGPDTTGNISVLKDFSPNGSPSPSFNISLTEPQIGDEVTFDASGSSDDGTITTYEWDLNNDGSFESTGETITTTFDSTGEYTVTLRVTDDQGKSATTAQTVNVTQSAFQQIKETHINTAETLENATISDMGVVSEAQSANDAYTTAVENNEISESTAVEALRRLNLACDVTLNVSEQIGPHPDGINNTNNVDLTQSMAAPTIQTVMDLFTGALSMAQAAETADDSGSLVQTVVDTAKDQVQSGVNTLVKYILGESSDVAGTVKIEASQIAENLLNNFYDTAADVNNIIEEINSQIIESASASLQTYVEQGNAIGTPEIPQLEGTIFEDNPLTLDGGITLMYEILSVDRVSNNGLSGSTSTAASAVSTTIQKVSNQAEQSESDIATFKELSEDTGLHESLIELVQEPNIYNAVTGVLAVLSEIIGSIPNAIATGAGLGGLIEINIRHHIGLYSIVEGEDYA